MLRFITLITFIIIIWCKERKNYYGLITHTKKTKTYHKPVKKFKKELKNKINGITEIFYMRQKRIIFGVRDICVCVFIYYLRWKIHETTHVNYIWHMVYTKNTLNSCK